MLRSRSRQDKFVDLCHSSPSFAHSETRRLHRRHRLRTYWWKILLTSLFMSLPFCMYRSKPSQDAPTRPNVAKSTRRVIERQTKQTSIYDQDKGFFQEKQPFLVDRAILQRLERLQSLLDDEEVEDMLPTSSLNSWPPIVTSLPEDRHTRSQRKSSSRPPARDSKDLLLSRHSRFLLAVRLPGLETDARNHLLQLIQLAQALNRTLILPRVSKGRIGACFQWDFETYYDTHSLEKSNVRFVTMAELSKRSAKSTYTTQVVSILAREWGRADTYERPLTIQVDEFYDMRELNLPGCFATKLSFLSLDDFSHLRLYVTNSANGDHISETLATVKDATCFQLPGASRSHAPDVLAVNWDIRFPIFPDAASQVSLRYSEHLTALAQQIAPPAPYLAIYWHMTGIPPDLLPHCADSLVDVVARLLSDPLTSAGVETVLFASDHPQYHKRQTENKRPDPIPSPRLSRRWIYDGLNKSTRPKSLLNERYEESWEILKAAFAPDGPLAEWRLTELTELVHEQRQPQNGAGMDEDLLHDVGVLGILNKLISSRATLFVSGVRACGSTSVFTQQIIDMRREERAEHGEETLRNLVDIFG
ncbi:hypothetical protein D9615_009096 [Tricholomella constricta]|uniref:Uncharacterized protein n=1 Tax=Tricholomella constricta TaxID=117010 RepID=A0A8H5LYS5_9AGAR|nr:hypothetical protein D9615_009096 [Tricholomella constricta]